MRDNTLKDAVIPQEAIVATFQWLVDVSKIRSEAKPLLWRASHRKRLKTLKSTCSSSCYDKTSACSILEVLIIDMIFFTPSTVFQ